MNHTNTKGPWIARPDVFDLKTNAIDIVSSETTKLGDNISVATVFGSTVYGEGQKKANAHLIAAAPEMLDALECVIGCFPYGTGSFSVSQLEDALKKAHNAIIKAMGAQ